MTISPFSNGTLQMQVNNTGFVSIIAGDYIEFTGTNIQIQATPNPGYHLLNVVRDGVDLGNSTLVTFTMGDVPSTITFSFGIPPPPTPGLDFRYLWLVGGIALAAVVGYYIYRGR